jgi:hypothetical protein
MTTTNFPHTGRRPSALRRVSANDGLGTGNGEDVTVKNHPLEKAKKTLDTLELHRFLVICNQCGSSAVGLRGKDSLREIVCESCGNLMPWDVDRFTLLSHDAVHPSPTMVEVEHAIESTQESAGDS